MKRLLLLCTGVVYFCMSSIVRRVCVLLRLHRPGQGIVLCYHAIPAGESPRFRWQMDMLLHAGTPVPAHIRDSVPPGRRWIAVTFDDVYQSVLTGALPVLRERRIPCTLFVISGRLGEIAPWANRPGYTIGDPFVTTRELLQLQHELIEVGSHTHSHPQLPEILAEEAVEELQSSRDRLQDLLREPVHLFAFPYGAHTPDLLSVCFSAGYTRAFTVEPRPAFQVQNELVTGRVVADPSDWRLEFWLKLRGAYCWRAPVLRWRETLRGGRGGVAGITTDPAVRKLLQERVQPAGPT